MGEKECAGTDQKKFSDCQGLERLRNEYLALVKNIYELQGGDKNAGPWKMLIQDTAFQALVTDLEFTKSFLNFISTRRTMIRPSVWRQIFIPLFRQWEELFPQEELAGTYPGLFEIPPDKRLRNGLLVALVLVAAPFYLHQIELKKALRLEIELQEKYGLEMTVEKEKGSSYYKAYPTAQPEFVFKAGKIPYRDLARKKQTQTDTYPAALAAQTAEALGITVRDIENRSVTLTYESFGTLEDFSGKLVKLAASLEEAVRDWPEKPGYDMQVTLKILSSSGYEKNLTPFETSLYAPDLSGIVQKRGETWSMTGQLSDIAQALKAYEVSKIYDWEPEKIQALPAGASAYREKQDSIMVGTREYPFGGNKNFLTYGQVYQLALGEGKLIETGSDYYIADGVEGKVKFSLVIRERAEPDMAFEYLETHVKSEPLSGFTRYDLNQILGIEAGY